MYFVSYIDIAKPVLAAWRPLQIKQQDECVFFCGQQPLLGAFFHFVYMANFSKQLPRLTPVHRLHLSSETAEAAADEPTQVA